MAVEGHSTSQCPVMSGLKQPEARIGKHMSFLSRLQTAKKCQHWVTILDPGVFFPFSNLGRLGKKVIGIRARL